jgi:hypothetical protein
VVVACACYMLWFKQYIYVACGNKEHQPPNNMYYEIQAWKSVLPEAPPPLRPQKLAPSEFAQEAGSEARFRNPEARFWISGARFRVKKCASCPKTHFFCFFELS